MRTISTQQRLILEQQTALLKHDLEYGSDKDRKSALQEVSQLYRRGLYLPEAQRGAIELSIVGLLGTSADDKVVRWCLNTLAQLGHTPAIPPIQDAIRRYEGSPEIVGAGIAALSRLQPGGVDLQSLPNGIPREVAVLASLQHLAPHRVNLHGFSIDVEKASIDTLKLALLAVGLNRDFPNLFHPRHDNDVFVRLLGQHDDLIVRQYSVWSVIENRHLTISALGVPFSTLEEQPPNVQSKLLELAAKQIANPVERLDLVARGVNLRSEVSREGLAKGLRDIRFDALEQTMLDWFRVEGSNMIRGLLSEHFARFATEFLPYRRQVFEILESEPQMKRRLLAGAEGTKTFSDIKAWEAHNDAGGLFPELSESLSASIRSTKLEALKPTKNLLIFLASPLDQGSLHLLGELREIIEKIRLIDDRKLDLSVRTAPATRLSDIQTELLNHRPSLLHFAGHGDGRVLVFETNDGGTAMLTGAALASNVRAIGGVECVVLNACYSARLAKAVASEVGVVIGCKSSVGDEAAKLFSRAFYRALVAGESYERAFDFGKVELETHHYLKDAKLYTLTKGAKAAIYN